MAYRNKTYICFDGDTDMKYYRLMTAWAANERYSFDFHNAHDLNTASDTSQEESIKRQLMERLKNSKVFIVLVGEKTKLLTKFVKWELEVAQRIGIPIIAVNLNGSRMRDEFCPPAIRDSLAVFVSFHQKIIEHAMANWPNTALEKKAEGGSFYYSDHVYAGLGLQ